MAFQRPSGEKTCVVFEHMCLNHDFLCNDMLNIVQMVREDRLLLSLQASSRVVTAVKHYHCCIEDS